MVQANKILFLIFIPIFIFGQSLLAQNNFDYLITTAKGDLNNDKIADSCVVLHDTLADNQPFRLRIYFKNSRGGYDLALQSDSAIEARYPNGKTGLINSTLFLGISIKSGSLIISEELTRGHYEHKFRFQRGRFELIGFTQVYSDGQGIVYMTDYNLTTGVLLETSERYDTGKRLSKKRKVLKVNFLPDLLTFKPYTTDIY